MIELQDIPKLEDEHQAVHRIKALSIDGRNPALDALLRWKRDCLADFKKIMRAIKYVGTHERKDIHNPNYVKKCDNPDYEDVFEFRAHKGKARLFFFFSPLNQAVVICTNEHEKDDALRGKSSGQDAAFKRCDEMKKLYIRSMQ